MSSNGKGEFDVSDLEDTEPDLETARIGLPLEGAFGSFTWVVFRGGGLVYIRDQLGGSVMLNGGDMSDIADELEIFASELRKMHRRTS